jgi:hypothetical protein
LNLALIHDNYATYHLYVSAGTAIEFPYVYKSNEHEPQQHFFEAYSHIQLSWLKKLNKASNLPVLPGGFSMAKVHDVKQMFAFSRSHNEPKGLGKEHFLGDDSATATTVKWPCQHNTQMLTIVKHYTRYYMVYHHQRLQGHNLHHNVGKLAPGPHADEMSRHLNPESILFTLFHYMHFICIDPFVSFKTFNFISLHMSFTFFTAFLHFAETFIHDGVG